MSSLNHIFRNHQLCSLQKKVRKRAILYVFQRWIKEDNFEDFHLALYKFATIRPLKYFDSDAIEVALELFDNHPKETFDSLFELNREITHATMSITREGSSWNQEQRLSLQDPKDMNKFERIWHPEYQRYSEHIFNHLINIPLKILGKLHGKNYLQLTLKNRIDTLKKNNFKELTKGFNSIIRNAISHGSCSFEMFSINYEDLKTNIVLAAFEFSKLFDSLINVCHSILIAIIIFLCKHKTELIKKNISLLPLGLRFLIIDGIASHQDFKLTAMIESIIHYNKKQLNIHCSTTTLSRRAHIFETLNIVWNTINLGGQVYERFGVSIDCGKTISSSLFLNGSKLRDAIKRDLTLNECSKNILETSLLWFDTSKFMERFYIWKNIFSLQLQIFKKDIVNQWKEMGRKIYSSRYIIRHIENKSTESIRRIEAHVILTDRDTTEERSINGIIRHIIKKLKKHRVKTIGFGEEGSFKRRPSHIWIKLFAHDDRIRTLSSSVWADRNLILNAEWISKWKKIEAVLVKKADRIYRKIHIQYNPEIIEESKQ